MNLLTKPTFFCQFDSETSQGARYRVGIEKPTFYVLKPKVKKDFALKGFQQKYDLYREYPNTLFKIQDNKVSAKLNAMISKAVNAKSNSDHFETLNSIGYFERPRFSPNQRIAYNNALFNA
ncbi:hypothetical protein EXE10_18960 [Acinetobacter sp. WCHAc060033]|uniref:hypothetical protein n=1 Tax=Acinetobacter sp. WCHAc060033 TaxID=2518624 RepID=UPI001023B36F|nr:hypothetical protein [Acinetobacter sp. WCHAc060033]RZG77619.1 hypothetical protein EXE10_18960 [Acinetobacter sp. WCHAc060033]